jgi:hypothetical protein
MRGAAILHQVLPEAWRFQSGNNPEDSTGESEYTCTLSD